MQTIVVPWSADGRHLEARRQHGEMPAPANVITLRPPTIARAVCMRWLIIAMTVWTRVGRRSVRSSLWGDIEVHRTGFRAQYACIVALALPAVCGEENRRRLAAAAARYGVPLVPDDRLMEIALEYGQRLRFDEVPRRRRDPQPVAGTVPPLSLGGPLGTAVDDHVHVELDDRLVWIRLTPTLAGELPAGAAVHQRVDEGDSVRCGDTLATVDVGEETIVVRSPLSALIALPHGSSTKNWRLGLIPTCWDVEALESRVGRAGLAPLRCADR